MSARSSHWSLNRSPNLAEPPRPRCRSAIALVAATILGTAGCVLAPRDAAREHDLAATAGRAYQEPFPDRALPALAAEPDWRSFLERAFLANGELEAAYYEWQAALERIAIAAGWPNSNVAVGFDYLFSGGNAKAWDRSTLRLGFDSMQNVALPQKVMAAGRVALEDARSAGRRFAAEKFALQERVLTALLDHALTAERIRLQERELTLLALAADTASARVAVGGSQTDIAEAEAQRLMAMNALETMRAELPQQRAMLNAMVARPHEAGLPLGSRLPAPRPLDVPDDRLLAIGVEGNPGLAALAAQVAGRTDAIQVARLQYLPDFSPAASFAGGAEQMVGTMVMLATRIPQIEASIREARTMAAAADALLRQARLDRGAMFVATLAALRDDERRIALLRDRVAPVVEAAAASARSGYSTGGTMLTDWLAAERARIEVARLVAESRIAREKRLAALEALAGVDAETLDGAAPPVLALRAVGGPTP